MKGLKIAFTVMLSALLLTVLLCSCNDEKESAEEPFDVVEDVNETADDNGEIPDVGHVNDGNGESEIPSDDKSDDTPDVKPEDKPIDNTGDEKTDETTNVPETPETETVSLKLYFPDGEALYLHVEERSVELLAEDSREMAVLNELFNGPKNEELSPSLEGKNLINSVVTDENGLCTIDFKYDFVTLNTGGTARESFVIGSIVNSLCELENVQSVKINIDGNTAAEFGHSTLEAEYRPMTTLVAK